MLSSHTITADTLLHISHEMMREPFFKKIIANMKKSGIKYTEADVAKCKALITEKNAECEELLVIALREKHLPTIRLLLDAGRDINQLLELNKKLIAPLLLAIKLNATEISSILISEYHADTTVMFAQESALYLAAGVDLSLVKLIVNGRSLSEVEKGMPALVNAALLGKTDIALYLLDEGADVNVEKASKESVCYPLALSIMNNHVECTELFIARGAEFNVHVKRIINQKVKVGEVSIVRAALSAANESTYEIDDVDYHPYYHLPQQQNIKNEFIRLFIEKKIIDFPSIALLKIQDTLKTYLDQSDITSFKALFNNTLQNNLHPYAKRVLYNTVHHLIMALDISQPSYSNLFSQLIPEILSLPNQDGKVSAIHAAILSCNITALSLLLENGIDPNIECEVSGTRFTPLYHLASLDDEALAINGAELLLKYGADIRYKNKMGRTLLFNAVMYGRLDLVNFLVAKGVDIYAQDHRGSVALDTLISRGDNLALLQAYFSQAGSDVGKFYPSFSWAIKCKRYHTLLWLLYKLAGKDYQPEEAEVVMKVCDNYIASLIVLGASLETIMPLLKWVGQNNLSDEFVELIYRSVNVSRDKFLLSSSAEVGLDTLITLRDLLKGPKNSLIASLNEFFSNADLKKSNIGNHSGVTNILLLGLVVDLMTTLNNLCEESLAVNKELVISLSRINASIELANKLPTLLGYFINVFYVEKFETTLFTEMSAVLLLLHERRSRLQREIKTAANKEKIKTVNSIDSWKMEERNRLLDQEAERLKTMKAQERESRRDEQSKRDRERWEKSNGFVQVSASKAAGFCTSDFFSKDQAVRTVELTPDIKNAFQLLSVIEGDAYLVGSAVLTLLADEIVKAADIDIVASTSSSSLTDIGFYKSPHVDGLHTYKKQDMSIDVVARQADQKKWQLKDLRRRDFTICQLYCDSQGRIYDPTGRGLHDHQNKVLSMGKRNPVFAFKDDPIRLLRAIKFIARGYQPDESLSHAMINFQSADLTDKHKVHLHAYVRHYLRSQDCQKFVQLLAKYQLLKPLFNIEYNGDTENIDNPNALILQIWDAVQTKVQLDGNSVLTPKA